MTKLVCSIGLADHRGPTNHWCAAQSTAATSATTRPAWTYRALIGGRNVASVPMPASAAQMVDMLLIGIKPLALHWRVACA